MHNQVFSSLISGKAVAIDVVIQLQLWVEKLEPQNKQ